jgi:hypothetical protein
MGSEIAADALLVLDLGGVAEPGEAHPAVDSRADAHAWLSVVIFPS